MEGGNSNSAGMGDVFAKHTEHMSPAHAKFLAHWLRLVDLEEGDLTARRAEIWALPGTPQLHAEFRRKAPQLHASLSGMPPQLLAEQ